MVLPAEDYDQDLLWGAIEEAGAPSSLGPTTRHPQAPDFGEADRHGDGHTIAGDVINDEAIEKLLKGLAQAPLGLSVMTIFGFPFQRRRRRRRC